MSLDLPAYQAGRFSVDLVKGTEDIAEAQAFRARCFELRRDRDVDALDPACDHILIRDSDTRETVCCYRMLQVSGSDVLQCYSARYYDISALERFEGNFLEMGRFCMDPARRDPDILRLAWAAMTAYVDAYDVTLLFGCSSFKGLDPMPYRHAFAYLRANAQAPEGWAPGIKAENVYPFAEDVTDASDNRLALKQMPPLLRTYLGMGGWVSDHAVIDRDMNTLHVFTGVETAEIPAARQRLLRSLKHSGQSAH